MNLAPREANVAGFVLAGGRSSRMGRNKALLELAGKPLIEHAVTKLRKVCEAVSILGGDSSLAPYGELVADLHRNCGPLGGMEAGLASTRHEWNLFYPVDLPFLPTAALHRLITAVTGAPEAKFGHFTVASKPQPVLVLLHRALLPYISESIELNEFAVYPALLRAADRYAKETGGSAVCKLEAEEVLKHLVEQQPLERESDPGKVHHGIAQATDLWFANLNTPEDFAEAEEAVEASGCSGAEDNS